MAPFSRLFRSAFAASLLCSAILAACAGESSDGTIGTTGGSGATVGGSSSLAGGGSGARGGNSSQGGTVSNTGGAIAQGGVSSTGVSCSQTKLLCKMAAPACAAMQVSEMTADGTCYAGNCVPIGNCACSAATDCPDNSQYTCNNSAKRCTPYLN